MNIIRACIGLMLGSLMGCAAVGMQGEDETESQFAYLAESTTRQVARLSPGLTLAGTGGHLDHSNGTHYNDLVFQFSQKLDRHTGTVLIKNIVDDYVKRVNSSKALKKYLNDHEFQHRHLSVSVMYLSPTGESVVHPEICAARYGNGKIIFYTWKVDGYGIQQKEEHDYEEALREFGS